MQVMVKHTTALAKDFNLSPEYWLARSKAGSLGKGTALSEIVVNAKRTERPSTEARFILDTGSAREGLIDIPLVGEACNARVSNKKVVEEGDVIVSRLRPYLKQVAYIPSGTKHLLGVDTIYCSTEFYVLRPQQGQSIAYLVSWLLSPPIQKMLTDATTGGHHPRFDLDLILKAPVQKPFQSKELSDHVTGLCLAHLKNQTNMRKLLSDCPVAGVAAFA